MDLIGPVPVQSLGGCLYTLVVVDDFSRFTWTKFLKAKSDAFDAFFALCKRLQNQQNNIIVYIRKDHGKEFENSSFIEFCEECGITHNFSAPYTPQSNEIIERKNRTLQEMTNTMLNEYRRPKYFWVEAMSTACYILNRVLLRPIKMKTPYELYFDKTPKLDYFKVFGITSKAYQVFNLKTLVVEESMNVIFNESKPPSKFKDLVDEDKDSNEGNSNDVENIIRQMENLKLGNEIPTNSLELKETKVELPPEIPLIKDHPIDNVLDESGTVVRNKARLGAQGYTQIEGIDFDETYAHVARIESIRNIKLEYIDNEHNIADIFTKPLNSERFAKLRLDLGMLECSNRYETIRVPILRPSEYPIWKVKMATFLEATDPEYLERINEGPHKPTKLSVVVADQPAMTIPKEKDEYTAEDISSIAKDARGTDAIKKNRRTILTQEYEHFDSKADESLTDLYDRFIKLLNDLSLVDREYNLEDSNLKFLLALPKNWDLKSTTIRHNYDLTETTLDKIYVMLKTYELEMDQRSKRYGRKSKKVALKAEEESPNMIASKRGKGKALIIKSDSELSYSDDDDSETENLPEMDADEEMMKLCDLMVKGITKIAYRKFRKCKKFTRKSGSSDKKEFRKSEGKGGKSDRGDNSNVKCYNCGERGHISPDCKKGKSDKGKTLVTKKKSWTDTSDSEHEVNYALMANSDSNPETAELKTAKPKVNPVKFIAKTIKSDSEKMKESVTKVKDKSTSDKLKQDKPAEFNIGLMTKKQFKHKLKEIRNVNKVKEARKNRNGKEDFVEKAGPGVSYGNGNMGNTLGYGNINLGNVIIETVALVSGIKHNLLSVSQICDRGYHVDFFEEHCEVVSNSTGKVVLKGYSHVFALYGLCDSCQKAKQRKSSFKSKTESSILEPYHQLHVDLFGPVNVMSIAKKKYAMVIVDEFTRYTWVYFLHKKNETASTLTNHVRQLDKLVKDSVKIIRSDNGTEFKNSIMEEFCKEQGIKQEFSAPGTPQQNGVVERKNRTLIKSARTMLDEARLPTYFWVEAVQTACFT
ncbi:hypothetical protein AgCh_029148 [Apium graveolens]